MVIIPENYPELAKNACALKLSLALEAAGFFIPDGTPNTLKGNNATTNNPIVGSLGITNLQAYNDLLRNGVAVFNQVSSGVPVIYADSDDYNDYVKLKSIIYQNKLSTNVSITTLYSSFQSVYNDTNLALVNTGGTYNWGYQTLDSDGNTYTEYTATYFYVNYTFNNKTVNVKFYVDRY